MGAGPGAEGTLKGSANRYFKFIAAGLGIAQHWSIVVGAL